MSRINLPPELQAMANDLALLGNDAARTCAGFSTDTALERLARDLCAGKGKIMKLHRAVKAQLASERAAAKEAARLQAAQHKPAPRAGQLVGA